MSGSLVQNVEALFVGGVRIDELELLPDRSGEELGILGDEANSLAKPVEIDGRGRDAVVQNVTGLRLIETYQELHQCRLASPGRTDESDRLSELEPERDVCQRRSA